MLEFGGGGGFGGDEAEGGELTHMLNGVSLLDSGENIWEDLTSFSDNEDAVLEVPALLQMCYYLVHQLTLA